MFVSYTDLASKYPAGLDSEPELSDLMKEVAAEIPGKWRDVGLQLGLDPGVLDGIASISPGDTDHCYRNVFTRWKNQNSTTHPHTWSTVVQALQTPAVGEERLADKIKNKLSSHPLTPGQVKGELLTQTICHLVLKYFSHDSHTCNYVPYGNFFGDFNLANWQIFY